MRNRAQPVGREALLLRQWQATYSPPRSDPDLVRDLDAALVAEPNSAALHNAAGLALALSHRHPHFIELVTPYEECLPLMPPGQSFNEMIL